MQPPNRSRLRLGAGDGAALLRQLLPLARLRCAVEHPPRVQQCGRAGFADAASVARRRSASARYRKWAAAGSIGERNASTVSVATLTIAMPPPTHCRSTARARPATTRCLRSSPPSKSFCARRSRCRSQESRKPNARRCWRSTVGHTNPVGRYDPVADHAGGESRPRSPSAGRLHGASETTADLLFLLCGGGRPARQQSTRSAETS